MADNTHQLPFTYVQIEDALTKVITADSAPTGSSTKMVTSGGIRSYIDSISATASAGRDVLTARVDVLEAVPQVTGWEYHTDSTYTTGSRRTINDSNLAITIDQAGVGQNTSHSPLDTGAFFATNLITPEKVGDAYNLRVSFSAQAAATDSWFDIGLDISPTKDRTNVVLLDTLPMTKGTSEMHFTKSYTIFTLDTFLANGGALFIDTSESNDSVDFWDFTLLISRIHTS